MFNDLFILLTHYLSKLILSQEVNELYVLYVYIKIFCKPLYNIKYSYLILISLTDLFDT